MTTDTESARYCAGCMSCVTADGECVTCGWDDRQEPEVQVHLPRHYLLFERYYIGRVLGQGGFGVTYLARDLNLNRLVAVKEYFPLEQCSRATNRATVHSHGGDKKEQFEYGLQGFLKEAQALAQLDGHANIVSIADFRKGNGTAYLVMTYIDGLSLKQYVANQGGKLPYEMAIAILMPVMDALREIHSRGLLHRDISPANIMITREGQVKVVDFGAARYAIGEHSKSLSMILKPGYAPEEQYRTHGKQGPWTDIYATAATLYHCITGVVPPPAPDRLAEDELAPPSKYCTGIPPQIEAAITRGLALRAADRFQSVEQLQKALVTGETVPAQRTPLPETRPRPVPASIPQKLTRYSAITAAIATSLAAFALIFVFAITLREGIFLAVIISLKFSPIALSMFAIFRETRKPGARQILLRTYAYIAVAVPIIFWGILVGNALWTAKHGVLAEARSFLKIAPDFLLADCGAIIFLLGVARRWRTSLIRTVAPISAFWILMAMILGFLSSTSGALIRDFGKSIGVAFSICNSVATLAFLVLLLTIMKYGPIFLPTGTASNQHLPMAKEKQRRITSIGLAVLVAVLPFLVLPMMTLSLSGKELYDTGDYAAAVPKLEKAANGGDSKAAVDLAYMYVYGNGVPQDYAVHREWLQKAFEAGDANAADDIAEEYETGNDGLAKSAYMAYTWYVRADSKGSKWAALHLGRLFTQREPGLNQDFDQARIWYEKELEINPDSQVTTMRELGDIYREGGPGLQKNYARAAQYYEKVLATEKEPLEKSSDAKHAVFELGWMFQNGGYGLDQDYGKSVEWFKRGADAGDDVSMDFLAYDYQRGDLGVPQDLNLAREWYEKAIALGNNTAKEDLAKMNQ